jgi:hypothetical protein
MGGQAIEAAVFGGDRDRDHLALQLGEPRGRQHQIVVESGEGFELGHVMGVSRQHIGHEAELLAALLEIGRHGRGEFGRREGQRRDALLYPCLRFRLGHRFVPRCA